MKRAFPPLTTRRPRLAGGGGEYPGQMVAELAREGLDVGDKRDFAANLQAARRDLHAKRAAANHED